MLNTSKEAPLLFKCVKQPSKQGGDSGYQLGSEFAGCPVAGTSVLGAYGIEGTIEGKVGVILAMLVAFRIGAYFFLRYRWKTHTA
jgi:hypothetical protein